MKRWLFAIIAGLVMTAVLWAGPQAVVYADTVSEEHDAAVRVAGYIAADNKITRDNKITVPQRSEKQKSGEIPKTGDSSNIKVWFLAGGLSTLFIAGLLVKEQRQNRRQSEF